MSRWLSRRPNAPDAQPGLRLFCLPYAGGSATIYRDWQVALPSTIEVCPVHLPGRGSRFDEASHSSMRSLVAALAEGISGQLDRPFVIFGHSMGAMIAFELTRFLRSSGGPLPHHLFLSGRGGPEASSRGPTSLPMEDDELLEMLSALNGTSGEALRNQELISLMLPMLRADMTLVQTHRYEREPPFTFGITAFGGTEDATVDQVGLGRWREHTEGSFRLHLLEGDHFFLMKNKAPLINLVRRTLAVVMTNLQHAPVQ